MIYYLLFCKPEKYFGEVWAAYYERFELSRKFRNEGSKV